jgi:hypothetical protein
MARKGAMGKEPALRGAARKAFKREQYKNLPGPGGEPSVAPNPEGSGAQQIPQISPRVTAREPRQKAMERLSPGVYRGAEGALVGRGGRPLPQQAQPAPQPGMPGIPPGFQPNKGVGPMPPRSEENFMIEGGPAPMPQPGGSWMGGAPTMRPQPQPNMGDMFGGQMPQGPIQDGLGNFQPMPQPSANMGGQYRLSPGVYGSREEAMQQFTNPQFNPQLQPLYQPAMPMRRKY